MSMPPAQIDFPIWARSYVTHPAAQAIADQTGVDILHVKGPALDLSLNNNRPRLSSDCDVLVRPSQVDAFVAALAARGWSQRSTFAEGSAFEHAANWHHPLWGYIDVHRCWPGPQISPTQVFELLWADRVITEIAHQPCPTPNLVGQSLIMVLHAARGGQAERIDVKYAWEAQSADHRAAVTALAHRLQAETALAAGTTGDLSAFTDQPDYLLWRTYSQGAQGDRLADWRGRLAVQPTWGGKARVLARAMQVNRAYLEMELGHPPHAHEVRRAQRQRIAHLIQAVLSHLPGSRQ